MSIRVRCLMRSLSRRRRKELAVELWLGVRM
jgi:hypothetical protein